ncbi:MAG TPA: NAD-dependent epimerase/dehydratase family protein [Solirubrobacterales bacterium]|nr:NAD-dependent epimerase/dehydratase family protein [Solirubrobacterales bacterium]
MAGAAASDLTVAVTGPTGDIGIAALRALDASPAVAKVIGMARRPFDPAAHGLSDKVVYQRGDVLDRPSVDSLVDGADVVVHLAFIIIGDPDEAQRINTEGSRNVFDATVEAGARRLVYTSSVAAYGFHADNPQPLTEEVPPRGSEDFYYSAHKAELERVLDDAIAGSGTEAYVFRPCIVAGAGALTLIETTVRLLPIYGQLRLARRALDQIPFLGPVLPDPGAEFQLVHTLDVASALRAAVEGAGPPGRYNLAGPGSMSIARMARACGWWSVPVPGAAVAALSEVANRIPGLPPEVEWLNAFRAPTMMETRKARDELGWTPEWDAEATMRETVSGAREAGVL